MFKIKKTMELAISHHLDLPYESKCRNNHGHNLWVSIYCQADTLDGNGMVVDFTQLKAKIEDILDHTNLNEIGIEALKDFPTAENLAFWISLRVDDILEATNPSAVCYRVDVQESEGNIATFFDEQANEIALRRTYSKV